MTTPTIVAQLTESGEQLTFWCPHCRSKHFHSADPGHKTSHCWWTGSPYYKTGYYLELRRSSASGVNDPVNTVPAVSRRRRRAVATTPATSETDA